MKDKKLITKHNELIKASFRLSLTEIQLVAYAVSNINPLSSEPPLEYEINIKKFANQFGITNHDIYNHLKNVVLTKFWERDITLHNGKKKILIRWLTKVEYIDTRGVLSVKFSSDIMPFLCNLRSHFTTYALKQISTLKSAYAIRLYEFLLNEYNHFKFQRKDTKVWAVFETPIAEIREVLKIDASKYKRGNNFKKWVLENPLKEIDTKTDLHVSHTIIKRHRRIDAIEFKVRKKLTLEQIQAKKANKQKTLSSKLANIDHEIRLHKSNIESDCAKGDPDYLKEQTALLKEALLKRDEILAKIDPEAKSGQEEEKK